MKHQNLKFHENARILCVKHPLRNMSIFLLVSIGMSITGILVIVGFLIAL